MLTNFSEPIMGDSKENRRDQIDRYVNGMMTGDELSLFEQRMRENVQLAHAVHMHKDVLQGIEFHFMRQLKDKLIQSDQPQKSGLPTWAIILLIALGTAAIAAAFYFLR